MVSRRNALCQKRIEAFSAEVTEVIQSRVRAMGLNLRLVDQEVNIIPPSMVCTGELRALVAQLDILRGEAKKAHDRNDLRAATGIAAKIKRAEDHRTDCKSCISIAKVRRINASGCAYQFLNVLASWPITKWLLARNPHVFDEQKWREIT
jgi:hypothetical protein